MDKEKIFKITGMPLHPMYTINKIIWLKQNMPDVYKKAWKFLCVEDFVFFKLGVIPTIDYSLAARTMAFDVRKKVWSEEMLSSAEIDIGLLAQVKPSGEITGEIPDKIAQDLGFCRGAMAVTGGHDQCCGVLGAGVIKEGMAMNATGTSDVLSPVFSKPFLNKGMLNNNYCCYPHVKPEMYTSCAFNLTGGLLLRWYRDTFCEQEINEAEETGKDVYGIIINNATKGPASIYILPHFVGSGTPTLDPNSKDAILGLTLSTGKNDISKAVLDSINYELKLNIDTMETIGIKINELRAVGGGAKSREWLQLKADVFGKKVISLEVSEAACLGAAILAGSAIGEYKSVDDGVGKAVKIKAVYHPDKEEHEKYQVYTRIYPAISELSYQM